MVLEPYFMVLEPYFMVLGPIFMVLGPIFMVLGPIIPVLAMIIPVLAMIIPGYGPLYPDMGHYTRIWDPPCHPGYTLPVHCPAIPRCTASTLQARLSTVEGGYTGSDS